MTMLRMFLVFALVAAGSAAATAQTPDRAAPPAGAPVAEDRLEEPDADPAPPPAPYSSPMREECDGLIAADAGWACGLRAPIAKGFGIDAEGCAAPTTPAAKKSACEAELAKDTEWADYATLEHTIAVCDSEIGKDPDWHYELRLHFDQHMGLKTPDAAKPKAAGGAGSPAREACNALMMATPKWHASWKAEFEGINAYEFHDREAGYVTTNKKHVFGAYAAFLALFVVFLVVLFLRQRRLVAEIAQLRQDVERAAAE